MKRYDNGGKAMRRRQGKSSAIILALMGIAALLFGLTPTPASAGGSSQCSATDTLDTDMDGFTDCIEKSGFSVTLDGSSLTATDHTKKDLFVILVRATPSNIPTTIDPFLLAKNLGITIHVIERSQPVLDRTVNSSISTQKAVQITESLRTDVTELGVSTPGLPGGRDESTIYTSRIWQKLLEACPCIANNCNTCSDGATPATGGQALYPLYIQNVIAHEIGHLVRPVKQPYTTQYEYHYAEGTTSPSIMDRAIVSTKDRKTGFVKIPISKSFKQTDLDAVKYGSLK
jgi:hypothetical protein